MAAQPTPHPDGFCFCGSAREEHIGDKPCVRSPIRHARSIFDLPIAAWALVEVEHLEAR